MGIHARAIRTPLKEIVTRMTTGEQKSFANSLALMLVEAMQVFSVVLELESVTSYADLCQR
jgi:hypothetical protein